MNDTITTPDLIIEVHRYDKPENTFRFFEFSAGDISYNHENTKPFAISREDMGPNYLRTARCQISEAEAEVKRRAIEEDGFRPLSLEALPGHVRRWVIHSHCPIEFHSVLDNLDPEWTRRVTLWTNGSLPDDPREG
jgi:hypothetical protein